MHSRPQSRLSMSSTQSRTSVLSMISHSTPSTLATKPKEAYGSFTITRSAVKSLRDTSSFPPSRSSSRPRVTLQTNLIGVDHDSSPESPLESTPSITRTSSPDLDTAFPPTFLPPYLTARRRSRTTNDLNPILAGLEKRSKFCTSRMSCSTCLKPGNDYPKCPRCSEAWCSRECRLRGGKRHECALNSRKPRA
jgi:hypothetical protein